MIRNINIDEKKTNDKNDVSIEDCYPKSLKITDNTKIEFHYVKIEKHVKSTEKHDEEIKVVEEIVNKNLTLDQKDYLVLCRYFDCLQVIHQYLQYCPMDASVYYNFIFNTVKIENSKNGLRICYPFQKYTPNPKLKENNLDTIIKSFINIQLYFYFQLNVKYFTFESDDKNLFSKLYKYWEGNDKVKNIFIIPFFQNIVSNNPNDSIEFKIDAFNQYISKLTNDFNVFISELAQDKNYKYVPEKITSETIKKYKTGCEINCLFYKTLLELDGKSSKLALKEPSLNTKPIFIFSIFTGDLSFLLSEHYPKFDTIIQLLESDYNYKDLSKFVSNVYYHFKYKKPKILEFKDIIKIKSKFRKSLELSRKYLEGMENKSDDISELSKLHNLIADQVLKSLDNIIETGKKKKGKKKTDEMDKPKEENKYHSISLNEEEIEEFTNNLQNLYDILIKFKDPNNKKSFSDFIKDEEVDYEGELSKFFSLYDIIDQLINNRIEIYKIEDHMSVMIEPGVINLSLIGNTIELFDKFCMTIIQNKSRFYFLLGQIIKQLIKLGIHKTEYFKKETIEKYFNIKTIEKCYKICAYSTHDSEAFLKLAHIYKQNLKLWKYSLYKSDFKIDPKKYRYNLDISAFLFNPKANLELCKLFVKEKKYSNASYLLDKFDYKNDLECYLIKAEVLEYIDIHQCIQIILKFAFVDIEQQIKIDYQKGILLILMARNHLFRLFFKYLNHTTYRPNKFNTDLDSKLDPLYKMITKKMQAKSISAPGFTIPKFIFYIKAFKVLLEQVSILNVNHKIKLQEIKSLKILTKINEQRCEAERLLCEIDLFFLYKDTNKNQNEIKDDVETEGKNNDKYKCEINGTIFDRLKHLFYVHNYYPASILLGQLYFEISMYNEKENSILQNKNFNNTDKIIEITDDNIKYIIDENDRQKISLGKSNEFFLFAVNSGIYQFEDNDNNTKVKDNENNNENQATKESSNQNDDETYSSLFQNSLLDKDKKFNEIFYPNNDEKNKTKKDK